MSKNRVSLLVTPSSRGAKTALRVLFDRYFSIESVLTPDSIDEVMALRYQVYCRERAFENANRFPDGREQDEYDGRSVHALVRHRASNECVGGVRLVLADKHNLSALFPVEAHCADALPNTGMAQMAVTPRSRIAEISRLAVSRKICKRVMRRCTAAAYPKYDKFREPQVRLCVVLGLFSAVTRLTEQLGVTQWMAVMGPTLLRLLKRYGVHFHHVGDVANYHGRRRPVATEVRTLLDGIRATQPEVWDLITDSGAISPGRAYPGRPRRLTHVRNCVPIAAI